MRAASRSSHDPTADGRHFRDWDRDPFLLGTPAGTVDLRTGELREPDPRDGITKITAVSPAETADCPRWLQFLDETFGMILT